MEQQYEENNEEIHFYELWQVIMKRKVIIIGLFIICIFMSAIYSFLSPKIYRGYAIFNIVTSEPSNSISTKAEPSYFITANEITDFLGKVDHEKQKNILPKTYHSVKDVQIKALKDSKSKIMVTIDSKKIDDIPVAISEVLDYLNNLEIVKMNTRQNKEILQNKLRELSGLLKSAPDFLAKYQKLINAGKLSMIGFNPLEISKNIIETKMEVLQIEQKILKFNKGGIEMAVQPQVSGQPVSPKTKKNIVIAGILSLFMGILLVFLIEYFENVKKQRTQADHMSNN